MNVLVVGGAGYIGSHMTLLLAQRGHVPTVLDDLSSGHAEAVLGARLVEGTMADEALLDELLAGERFDAIMHFASYIQVGESVTQPAKYYRNNVVNTLRLLDAAVKHGVLRFIFSSTAAVFGEPRYVPIDEAHPREPINPYGRTKWMVEQILHDYDRAYGLRSVSLRYFNAAGADPEARTGERHDPETHLIPLALQAASGRGGPLRVFGRDYDTPDGTCIRDYVHVVDLCEAHLLALDRLAGGAPSAAYNLGNGTGFSVQQVIDAVRSVTGREVPALDAPRRAGDPARLVADARRARQSLRWAPQRAALETIVADAWRWEQRRAEG